MRGEKVDETQPTNGTDVKFGKYDKTCERIATLQTAVSNRHKSEISNHSDSNANKTSTGKESILN